MHWKTAISIATLGAGIYISFLKLSQGNYDPSSIIPFVMSISFLYFYVKNGKWDLFNLANKWSVISGLCFGCALYYMNNALSLIQNPGIPSAVLRTNIVITYVASLFLFRESFSFSKVGFILLTLVGGFVAILPKLIGMNNDNITWLYPTLIAGCFASLSDITTKFGVSEVSNLDFSTIQVLVAGLLNYLFQYADTRNIGLQELDADVAKDKSSIDLLNTYPWISLVICIMGFTFFREYLGEAIQQSSNPVYPRAIFNSQFILTLVLSYFLQTDGTFTMYEGLGAVIIAMGVVGFSLFSK